MKRAWVIRGDALAVLKRLPDASVDSIVTDPPAGIAFMGKAWDDFGSTATFEARDAFVKWLTEIMVEARRVLKPGGHILVWTLPKTYHWTAWAIESAGFEIRDPIAHIFAQGFPKSLNVAKAIQKHLGVQPIGEKPPTLGMANNPQWNAVHRQLVMPEPEGVAAEHEGKGTALKPAREDWIMARRPLEGTVAQNVLKHGTGAINIDACRITSGGPSPSVQRRTSKRTTGTECPGGWRNRTSPETYAEERAGERLGRFPANVVLSHGEGCAPRGREGEASAQRRYATEDGDFTYTPGPRGGDARGRFPANLVMSHGEECQEVGTREVKTGTAVRRNGGGGRFFGGKQGGREGKAMEDTSHGENGRETIVAWECQEGCPVALLDQQSAHLKKGGDQAKGYDRGTPNVYSKLPPNKVWQAYGDEGGASRFLYVAKPPRKEKELGCEHLVAKERPGAFDDDAYEWKAPGGHRKAKPTTNHHPTVKPVGLMRYLVRMVTPPGGLVLDPFAGSGTTGVAALAEGRRFLGIERGMDYLPITRARLAHALGVRRDSSRGVACGCGRRGFLVCPSCAGASHLDEV